VDPYHPAVQLLYQITEPILAPLRRVIPPVAMMDISAIIALLLLQIIQEILKAIIRGL
jgi:YggT family protein